MLDDFNTRLEEKFDNASRLIEEKSQALINIIQSISETLIMTVKGLTRIVLSIIKQCIRLTINVLGLLLIVLAILFLVALGVDMPGMWGWLVLVCALIVAAVFFVALFTKSKKVEDTENKPKKHTSIFFTGCLMSLAVMFLYMVYISNYPPTDNLVVALGAYLTIVFFDTMHSIKDWFTSLMK
ncbi:MAG: hypothetical protein GY834_04545 [Bacteroidetes bacterium]|nr:hypothetical protein [Bacteroidota bacterium]